MTKEEYKELVESIDYTCFICSKVIHNNVVGVHLGNTATPYRIFVRFHFDCFQDNGCTMTRLKTLEDAAAPEKLDYFIFVVATPENFMEECVRDKNRFVIEKKQFYKEFGRFYYKEVKSRKDHD